MALPDQVEVARFPRLTKAQYDRVEKYLQAWKKEVTAAIKRYPKGSYELGQAQMMAWLRLIGKLGPMEERFGGFSPTQQAAIGWLDRHSDMEISGALDRYIDQIRQSLLYGLRGGVNPTEVAAWLFRATRDAEQNWRVIARTEMSRANNQGRLDVCAEQGFEYVWAPPHLFACQRCKDIIENRPFRIEDVRHVPPRGSDQPYIPLHPRCRHVWVGYDKDVFDLQQENQHKAEQTGYTEEQLDRMFTPGGELKPEFRNAVDWSIFGKGQNWREWTLSDAVAKVQQVRKGFFTNPQADLDPLLFERGRLKSGVAETIRRWFRHTFPRGDSWAKLYLTGGATSDQYLTHPEEDSDVDLQIVVDYDAMRHTEPAYATLSSPELHTALLTLIRATSDGVEAAPGVPLRPFIRPENTLSAFKADVALTGQSVWDVGRGAWMFRAPPSPSAELYGFPMLEGVGAVVAQQHPEWLAAARLKAQSIEDLLERNDGGESVKLAMRELYEDVHGDRKQSFEAGGGGNVGRGNFIWQYLVNYGSLIRLEQTLSQPAMAKIAPGYVWDGEDVAKADISPGVEHWITVHPNGPDGDSHAVLVRNLSSGHMLVIGGAGGHLNGVRLDPSRRMKGKAKRGPLEQPAALTPEEEEASRKEFERSQKIAERQLGRLRETEAGIKSRLAEFMDQNIQVNDGSVPFSELSPRDQVSARARAFNSALAIRTNDKLDKEELQSAIRLKKDETIQDEDEKPETAGEEYGKPDEAESDPEKPHPDDIEPENEDEDGEEKPERKPRPVYVKLDDDQAEAVLKLRAEMSEVRARIRAANKMLRGEGDAVNAFTMDWQQGVSNRKAKMIEDETRTEVWRSMAEQLDDRNGNSQLRLAINQGGMNALNDIGAAIGVGEEIPEHAQALLGTAGTVQIMAHLIQQKAKEGGPSVQEVISQLDAIRDEREKRVVSLGVVRAQKAAHDANVATQDLRDLKAGNSISTSTSAHSRFQHALRDGASSLGMAAAGYEAMGALREALERDRSRMQLAGFDRASKIQALAAKAGVKLPQGAIKKQPGGKFMLDMDMDGFTDLMKPTHEEHTELSHQLAAIRTPSDLAREVERNRSNTPGYSGPKLYPSQAQGKMWLTTAKKGILAFEPGTGKTLTGISAALDVKAKHPDYKVLVVAPTNALCDVWASQINGNTEAGRFTTKVIGKRGLEEDSGDITNVKKKIESVADQTDFTIVSYETLASQTHRMMDDGKELSYRDAFRKQGYQIVIADEAQKVRHQKTGMAQGLNYVTGKSEYKWALTGTPVHKGLKDIHALYTWARGQGSLGMDARAFDQKWKDTAKYQHATAEEQVQRFRESTEDGVYWQPAVQNRKPSDPQLNADTNGRPEIHDVPLDPDHLARVRAGVTEFEAQRDRRKETGKGMWPSTMLIQDPTYRYKGSSAMHREIVRMADEHPPTKFQGKTYPPKTIVFDYEVKTLRPLLREAKKKGIKTFFTNGTEKNNDQVLEDYRNYPGKAILITSDKNKAAVSLQFGYNIGKDGVSRFQHGATQVIHLRPAQSNGDQEQRVARAFRKGGVANVDEHIMMPTDENGHRFPYAQAAIDRLDNERRLAGLVGNPEGRGGGESEPLAERFEERQAAREAA